MELSYLVLANCNAFSSALFSPTEIKYIQNAHFANIQNGVRYMSTMNGINLVYIECLIVSRLVL